MPQILPITTGTNAVWTPTGRKGNVVTYQDFGQSVPSLRKTLTVSSTEPSKQSKLHKVRIRMVAPVEAMDVNNQLLGTVAYINSLDLTFAFAASSSVDSRTDALSELIDYLTLSTDAPAIINDLTPLW